MNNNNKKNKFVPKPVEQPEETKEVLPIKEEVQEPVEPEIVDAEVDGVNLMLNIRSTPNVEEGNVIMQLKKGTRLQVVEPKKAKNDWYKIIITDKKTEGYAMKKYIKII